MHILRRIENYQRKGYGGTDVYLNEGHYDDYEEYVKHITDIIIFLEKMGHVVKRYSKDDPNNPDGEIISINDGDCAKCGEKSIN